MKTNFALIVIVALIALSSSSAFAVSWSNQGTKEERSTAREELRTKMTTARDTMLEEKEALRERVKAGETDAMQRIGKLHATQLTIRTGFYYERLKGIYDRLGRAISAAETSYGVDKLARAKSLWNQAGTKLEEAKVLAEKAGNDFNTVEGADLKSQRTEVLAARDEARAALTAFKDATKLMKDAAKELRSVINANRPSPTPKPSRSPRPSVSPNASSSPSTTLRNGGKRINTNPVIPPPVN